MGGYVVYGPFGNRSVIYEPGVRIPFFIFGLPVTSLYNFSNGASFFLVWVTYMIFLKSSLRGPKFGYGGALRALTQGDVRAVFGSTMLTLTFIFTVTWSVTSILQWLQEHAGLPTGDLPPREPVDQLVSISISPLTEELGFRLTLIGFLSLFWIRSRVSAKDLLRILWHPGRYLKWDGYQRGLERRAAGAIIFAGVLFGLSHVLYGQNWGLGKVTTASISGIALGWLYFKYGFPAAVLLHWGFNYFTGSVFYFGELLGFPSLHLLTEGLLYSAALVYLGTLAVSILRGPRVSQV